MKYDTKPFRGNIEKITNDNNYYRRVLHTTPQQQLVVMSVEPMQDIPMEKHTDVSQLIRIESGNGSAKIGNTTKRLENNTLIVIPPNTYHQIRNTSKTKSLKLYSVYSPPQHLPGTIHKKREDDPEH